MKKNIVIIFLFFNSIYSFSQMTDTGDKAGIGTTTPLGKLDIRSATDEVALRLSMPTSEDAAAYDIKWANTNADVVHRIQYSNSYYNFLNINRATRNITFNVGDITFNSGDVSFNGNNVFFNGDYVGIGTTTPLGKIDIRAETDEVALRLSMPTHEDAAAYDIKWANTNADVVHRIQYSNSYYDFMNVNRATRNVSFIGGNVGIGTSNPQSKLTVNGIIKSKEVVVSLDGWSDFVFDENYDLKDLEEIEEFIDKNNHLPDIPSENEVIQYGIQLGEMDAKLLQKIEELTLYMIEMYKEMKLLKRQNFELESKIKKMESE